MIQALSVIHKNKYSTACWLVALIGVLLLAAMRLHILQVLLRNTW